MTPMLYRRLPAVLILVLIAAPAAADWIVTREGARIETRGAWKVKGSQVVFTLTSGKFSSLQLKAVDLEASERATEEAKNPKKPAEEAPAPPPPSVLVLTDKDIPRGTLPPPPAATGEDEPADGEEATGGEESAGKVPAAAKAPSPVQVVAWKQQRSEEFDGIEIRGTAQNYAGTIVTDVGVKVSLFDGTGELLATADAFVDSASLAARSGTTFRALFPNIFGFDGVPTFETHARELFATTTATDESGGS